MSIKMLDLLGISGASLKFGKTGSILKSIASGFSVRNTGDTADAELTTSKLNNSGDTIVINSDAAGSGADWTYTLARPATGQTANRTITVPAAAPAIGDVLQSSDTAGTLVWAASASIPNALKLHSTALAFGSAATVTTNLTLPAGAILQQIRIVVDTAFNGTPTVTVGIAGTTAKYAAATDSDLNVAGAYHIHPNLPAPGASEAIILTYAAGGASAGAARVIFEYGTPSS